MRSPRFGFLAGAARHVARGPDRIICSPVPCSKHHAVSPSHFIKPSQHRMREALFPSFYNGRNGGAVERLWPQLHSFRTREALRVPPARAMHSRHPHVTSCGGLPGAPFHPVTEGAGSPGPGPVSLTDFHAGGSFGVRALQEGSSCGQGSRPGPAQGAPRRLLSPVRRLLTTAPRAWGRHLGTNQQIEGSRSPSAPRGSSGTWMGGAPSPVRPLRGRRRTGTALHHRPRRSRVSRRPGREEMCVSEVCERV